MEKSTPVRKPHASTADLLTWPETTPVADPPVVDSSARRSHKPSGGISPALFGGPMTEEEYESVNKRKLASGPKLREMTGSGIFSSDHQNGLSEPSGSKNPNNRTSVKVYQQAMSGISQISFSAEEAVSPRKPSSLPEVAKQRELSGNLESDSEAAKVQKQLSQAKTRELSGHDIFGPPPDIPTRPLAARNLELKGQLDFAEPAPRSAHSAATNPVSGQSNILSGEQSPAVKTSKKINIQKFQDLTGNDIFNGDAMAASAEKPLSSAKLKEMSGSDIFADGKAASREYFGGVRKPPGGGSSIALV